MTGQNIHQRLAAAMRVVKYIQNERRQGMQYRIVSHDKVTAKVRPALLDAGIVYYPVRCDYVQSGNRTECSVTVRFVNVDQPTDFFDVPTLGFGVDPQDKGPGKAMSYAVKYALLKALGLETGEDPDEDADTPDHVAEPPPADPPPRDPDAISAGLIAAVRKRDELFALEAFLGTDTFKKPMAWLRENHPEKAAHVDAETETRRQALEQGKAA